MAVEIPIEVQVDAGGLANLTKDLDSLKDKIRASTREIEDFKEEIAKMKSLGLPKEEIEAATNRLQGMEKALRDVKRTAEDKGLELNNLKDGTKSGQEGLKGLLGLGQSFGGKIGEFSGKGGQLLEVLNKMGPSGQKAAGGLAELGAKAAQNGGKIGLIIAAVIALIAILTAGIRAMIEFGKATIKASDAARQLNVTAVAAFKGKEGARDWADEVSVLRDKTGVATDKLQEMGLSLKQFKGDQYKSAFHAIAVATSALGDEGGKQIEGFVKKIREGAETAKSSKFQFKAEDLKDLPITVDELADSLAKIKGGTAAQALKDLKTNSVEVSDALLAVRGATDNAFGAAAQEKAKSVDNLSKKLSENWDKMFSGGNLKIFTFALEKLVGLFDESSAVGSTIKDVFTGVGQVLADLAGGAIWGFASAIEWIVGIVLDIENAWLEVQLAIEDVKDAFEEGGLLGAIEKIGDIMQGALESMVDSVFQLGADIIRGLIDGIVSMATSVVDAVKGIATSVVDAFKTLLKIKSPSRVFMELGGYVAEGAEEGIEDGTPGVEQAVGNMIPLAKVGEDIRNSDVTNNNNSTGAPVSLVFNITGSDGEDIANQVYIEVTKIFQKSAMSRGIDLSEARAMA